MSCILHVKILGIRTPQRYSVHRQVIAAGNEIERENPGFSIDVQEISQMQDILKYTQLLTWPVLIFHDKIVCAGRIPKKEEVKGWLQEWVDSL